MSDQEQEEVIPTMAQFESCLAPPPNLNQTPVAYVLPEMPKWLSYVNPTERIVGQESHTGAAVAIWSSGRAPARQVVYIGHRKMT